MTKIGPFVLLALTAFVPLFFLARAFAFGPRSRRLANVALFCGLAGMFLPELYTLGPADDGRLLRIAAVSRLGLAVTGLILIGVAIVLRRDGGLGLLRPVFAVTFCLLHVALGLGLLGVADYLAPSMPWTYSSEHVRLKLPSARWREVPGESPTFVCLMPLMKATVTAKPNQAMADYLQARQAIWDRVRAEAAQDQKVTRAEGTSAGNDFCSFTTESAQGGRSIYVSWALIHDEARKTLIKIHFEGTYRATTEAGRAAVRREFERAADVIRLSAE